MMYLCRGLSMTSAAPAQTQGATNRWGSLEDQVQVPRLVRYDKAVSSGHLSDPKLQGGSLSPVTIQHSCR